MTRLAILADLHGNVPALDAVLQDLATTSVDLVVVAGDVVSWGPDSAEVLRRLTDLRWAVIRGNNELYLTDYGTPRALAEWSDLSRFPVLPWLVRQLNDWQAAVAAWPDTLSLRFPDAPALRVVHGAPGDHFRSVRNDQSDAEVEATLSGVEESTVVVGHTHLQMDRQVGRWHVVNPGSVGVPLDGRHAAAYALLEGDASGWRASFRRAPFDVEPVLRGLERARLVEECGVIGRLIVEEFRTARIHLVPFLKWHDACCPDEPISLPLFDEYLKADWSLYAPAPYR